jgi:hypothetical protein
MKRGEKIICRHCGNKRRHIHRGLCNTCYHYRPGVRQMYALIVVPKPDKPKKPKGTPKNTNKRLPLPPEPTEHPTGSDEKIAVMSARASDGYQIFHPLDNRECATTLKADFADQPLMELLGAEEVAA